MGSKNGALLMFARKSAGLSREQIAAVCGVSKWTVGRWETGKASPQLWQAAAIADALGCSLDDLVTSERNTARR